MSKVHAARSKVAIVGAGNVGSAFAFSLMISGISREIVLIDRNTEKAEGESMDLNHGASFVSPVNIYSAGYEGCAGAKVVVITAGARQKPGETRIDLVQRNVEIFKSIIPQVVKYAEDAILLIVSNPVDILTYMSLKISGFPAERVIGSGTVLDSSRFRHLISKHCGLDPRNIHAYIVGEHGDTELPVWSHANIGGMLLPEYYAVCEKDCDYENDFKKIFEDVKKAAYKVIEAKGASYYAIGLSLVRIVKALLRNEHSVLPISSLISDYYGVDDICLSMPSVIGKKGVEKVLKLELSDIEQKQFQHSAKTLKDIVKSIKI